MSYWRGKEGEACGNKEQKREELSLEIASAVLLSLPGI